MIVDSVSTFIKLKIDRTLILTFLMMLMFQNKDKKL